MDTLRAFVVEDSPVVIDSLVAALEELAPIKVVGVVADERSAVQWMKTHAFECDIVITDIFLKDGSGLGVLRAGASSGRNQWTWWFSAITRRRTFVASASSWAAHRCSTSPPRLMP